MHELSMARNILEIIRSHIPAGSEEGVELVRVHVGALAGIMPENLDFCFRSLVTGTAFKGARLEITPVPVQGCCNRCGCTSTMEVTEVICPSCKSPDVTVVAGRELQVSEIILREHAKGAS